MQPPEQNGEAPSPAEMLSKYPQPIVDLVVALWTATLKEEAAAVQAALPAKPLKQLLENACTVLKAEKTLLEVRDPAVVAEFHLAGRWQGPVPAFAAAQSNHGGSKTTADKQACQQRGGGAGAAQASKERACDWLSKDLLRLFPVRAAYQH